jgi:hypothetical protein
MRCDKAINVASSLKTLLLLATMSLLSLAGANPSSATSLPSQKTSISTLDRSMVTKGFTQAIKANQSVVAIKDTWVEGKIIDQEVSVNLPDKYALQTVFVAFSQKSPTGTSRTFKLSATKLDGTASVIFKCKNLIRVGGKLIFTVGGKVVYTKKVTTIGFTGVPVAVTTYTFTYTTSSGGSLTGLLTQDVKFGSNGTPVTAAADAGYSFTSWSDGNTSNPRTDLNASGNITVSAIFTATSSGA